MKVLIAKMNEGIIKEFHPKAKFGAHLQVNGQESEHLSLLSISEKKFMELKGKVTAAGYNPYALMSW